jgi:hypothetical protein
MALPSLSLTVPVKVYADAVPHNAAMAAVESNVEIFLHII